MGVPIRHVLAMVVFAICYLWIYWVPFLLVPVGPELQRLANLAALGVAIAIAWLVWSKASKAPATLISWVLRGAAVMCGIGFVAGVLSGPVLFPTKPNQGLLLGFFFTGPAGAVLGGFSGLVVWSKRAKLGRAA
jgi:hypothetical protein